MAAVFGMYPGINSSATTVGANSGGLPIGLGTSGIDFRQIYVTAGTKTAGTFKFGRDLGIFGSDAILSDATLLSVGATGSNANPGNTSLGRIGYGYIYADFMPQISYASPIWGGFQATVGVFQPLDEIAFAGDAYSGTANQHSVPMFQGKVTYDYKFGPVAGRLWLSGLYQQQQNVMGPAGRHHRRWPSDPASDRRRRRRQGRHRTAGPGRLLLPRHWRGHDGAVLRRHRLERQNPRLRKASTSRAATS